MPNKQTSVLKRFVVLLMSGFSLFAKAFRATYHQIWVSGIVLALVTMLFAIALFFAEHSASPDYSFWDALEFQASFGIYIPVRTLNTYPRAMEILNRISYKPLLSLLGLVANSFLIVAIISKV